MHDLIWKLENEGTKASIDSALMLERWFDEYLRTGSLIFYNKIYGFIFGLYASGYISDDERTDLTCELLTCH